MNLADQFSDHTPNELCCWNTNMSSSELVLSDIFILSFLGVITELHSDFEVWGSVAVFNLIREEHPNPNTGATPGTQDLLYS